MTPQEVERVSKMQAGYEIRLSRQRDRLDRMLRFLEARGLVDDFTSFAATLAVGEDSPGPAESPDNKEGTS